MKTISTIPQARTAKAGVYKVVGPGAEGLTFRKVNDTPGVGAFNRRYRIHGERRTMSVGKLTDFSSIAEVIKRSQKLMAGRDEGVDPIEARRAKKAAAAAKKQSVNVIQATEAHLEAHARKWRGLRAKQTWLAPLKRHAFPLLGHMSVNDVMAEHIAAVVRVAAEADAPVAGERARSRLWAVFNGVLAKHQRDPVRGNPADAKLVGAIYPLESGPRPNFRRIEKLDDVPAKIRAIDEARAHVLPSVAAALDTWLFLAATALRPSEALLSRWDGVDFDKRLLTIPAAGTKSGREHVVPLSSLALEVLERRLKVRTGDYVFAGRSGSPIAYSSFARAPMKAGVDCGSPHSLRSIFRDWATEIGGVSPSLAELALAHLLGKTERAYARGTMIEQRRVVMEAYAGWLVGVEAEVIAFRRA